MTFLFQVVIKHGTRDAMIEAYFRIFNELKETFPDDKHLLMLCKKASMWSINYSFENMLRSGHGIFMSIYNIIPYKKRAFRKYGFRLLAYDSRALYIDIKTRL